jgi:hypothetical protein
MGRDPASSSYEDKQLDHDKREGTTLVVAIRPWELSLFTELRRKRAPENAPPVRTQTSMSSR